MDLRLVTSVLSVLAVLLSLAQASPQEASAEVLTKSSPLEVSALEDAKTSPIEKIGEKRESPEPATALGAKLNVHFPSEEGSKQVLAMKEDVDDSVRSPRQSPMMSFGNGPHTTTVCIQVRSDPHHPEVVCGPQVEGKKEDPPAARYAYPEYYARASPQYPPRYAQQLPPPVPMAPPPIPMRVPVHPARRREEEVLKPVEHFIPQPPLRVVSAPPPTPVVINRPSYYPVPVMAASYYPQTSQLLKLNCGVQPEGAQFLNSPLLRSSPSSVLMGYYPVGEQVILQDGSSELLLPREQSVYSSPLRARMSSDVLNLESPYSYSAADPWSQSAYLGNSGFYPADMQGRSAGIDSDQPYSNSLGYPYESAMDESTKSLLRGQELRQAQLRLKMLQNQLSELHQRSATEEALKDASATNIPHESSPGHEQKKDQAARSSKRQTRPKDI